MLRCVASLMLCLPLVGCGAGAAEGALRVDLAREQARSRAAEADAATARAELARVREEQARVQARDEDRAREVSSAKFDEARAADERDAARALVEQLRGELGLAGKHLRDFDRDRRALRDDLEKAEVRLGVAEARLDAWSRLTLMLSADVAAGRVTLALDESGVRVEAPGPEPAPEAWARTVVALAAALASEERHVLWVTVAPLPDREASAARLAGLGGDLTGAGVPAERVLLSDAPATVSWSVLLSARDVSR